jgi:hypothetical protein
MFGRFLSIAAFSADVTTVAAKNVAGVVRATLKRISISSISTLIYFTLPIKIK